MFLQEKKNWERGMRESSVARINCAVPCLRISDTLTWLATTAAGRSDRMDAEESGINAGQGTDDPDGLAELLQKTTNSFRSLRRQLLPDPRGSLPPTSNSPDWLLFCRDAGPKSIRPRKPPFVFPEEKLSSGLLCRGRYLRHTFLMNQVRKRYLDLR